MLSLRVQWNAGLCYWRGCWERLQHTTRCLVPAHCMSPHPTTPARRHAPQASTSSTRLLIRNALLPFHNCEIWCSLLLNVSQVLLRERRFGTSSCKMIYAEFSVLALHPMPEPRQTRCKPSSSNCFFVEAGDGLECYGGRGGEREPSRPRQHCPAGAARGRDSHELRVLHQRCAGPQSARGWSCT